MPSALISTGEFERGRDRVKKKSRSFDSLGHLKKMAVWKTMRVFSLTKDLPWFLFVKVLKCQLPTEFFLGWCAMGGIQLVDMVEEFHL